MERKRTLEGKGLGPRCHGESTAEEELRSSVGFSVPTPQPPLQSPDEAELISSFPTFPEVLLWGRERFQGLGMPVWLGHLPSVCHLSICQSP